MTAAAEHEQAGTAAQGEPPEDAAGDMRRFIPGLASLAVHVTVVALCALVLRPVARGLPKEEEAPRGAAVAIARRTAQATEYLSEEAPAELASANRAAAANSPADAAAVAAAAPQAAPSLTSGITLPEVGSTPPAEGAGQALGAVVGGGRPGAPIPGADAAALAEIAGRAGATGPLGPVATLSLFGASGGAKGNSFVLVVDRSASMGGEGLGAIELAVQELRRRLVNLSEEHKLQIVAYNNDVQMISPGKLLPATSENKERLLKFLGNIGAFGPTNHSRALLAALKLRPDVIFLLTDGDEPGLDLTQQRIIRTEAGRRTSIHCLQFGRGPLSDPGFMRRLALETGGEYQYVEVK